jgi:tetratricopeptide (TPR) repeat protein
MSDSARDLLVRGIAAAKAGERREAQRYLEWALRQEPSADERIEAWLWLSEVAAEEDEARRWVEEVLATEPHNPRALRRLALLEGRLHPSDLIDPDRPPASLPSEEPLEVERFACPSCGGRMVYAPDGDGLQCDHCGRRIGVASDEGSLGPAGEDFVLALATARGHNRPSLNPTFACSACGARFLLAPATLSLTCPYCDATYAVEESEARLLVAPRAIAPLRVSPEEARSSLVGWLAKEAEEGSFRIDRMTAVYLPFWLFELGGVIEWRDENGASRWMGEEDQPGGTEAPVSPIAVLACASPAPGSASAVESIDPALLVAFDAAYLAALPAETYSLSMANAALRARQRALWRTGEKLRIESRGARLSLRSARMVVTSCRLALAPVWLGHVTLSGAKRIASVSGVTARLHTEPTPPPLGD